VRPDGSSYGSRGKCKKGTEAGAKQETAADKKPSFKHFSDKGLREHTNLLLKVEPEKLSAKTGKAHGEQLKEAMAEMEARGMFKGVDKIVQEVKAQGGDSSAGTKGRGKVTDPKELSDLKRRASEGDREAIKRLMEHRDVTGLKPARGDTENQGWEQAPGNEQYKKDLEKGYKAEQKAKAKEGAGVTAMRQRARDTESDSTRKEFAAAAKDYQGRIDNLKEELKRSDADPKAIREQIAVWTGKLRFAKEKAKGA
jgi:hypothetical protein